MMLVAFLPFFAPASVTASDETRVMQSFNAAANASDVASFDETREQHEVLFIMGVILLVLIFLTAGFGLAMVLSDKKVFVYHMIFAGATVFLSLAHAVAAVVWFFPYR
ncbi:MAG: hypothetical protein OEW58_02865 [Gammaproteobacteria bacterium]|nr:hypothetical protein [Gammaproteobacteria bacterium]